MYESKIEKLYSTVELAQMVGERYQNVKKIFQGERRMGAEFYKFEGDKGHTRIPEHEVNRFRAMRGLAPITTDIPQKETYKVQEVADIVGLTAQRIYALIRGEETAHPLGHVLEHRVDIPRSELKHWYGEVLVSHLTERSYTSEEAAEALGVPLTEIEQLIINGKIESTAKERIMVSREQFLDWLAGARRVIPTNPNPRTSGPAGIIGRKAG